MLYQFFKYLFVPTIKAYFSSVRIINNQNIPSSGPVILAVNHTSAFMDPILVACFTKRTYHFLARGEAFNSKAANFFYKKLNMLPVFRPETMPDDVHKNKFVFKQCYDHLANGKAIMIFPEGFSKTERRIREIKSGLSRIALGAENQQDFSLDIKIVPIGINYSDPHRFRSDVLINVGEVISTSDYKDLFNSNEKKAYDLLTENVRKQLEKSTIYISDKRQESFIESIEWFYKSHPPKIGETPSFNAAQHFDLSKDIVKGVVFLADNHAKDFTALESKLDNYKNRVARLNLDQQKLNRPYPFYKVLIHLLFLTFGFPIFVLGFISNIIPFFLTGTLSKKLQVREDFIGSLKLTAGMFVFLILYLVQSYFTSFFLPSGFTLLSPLIFYTSGLFSLFFIKAFIEFIENLRHLYLSKKKGNFFNIISYEQAQLSKLLDDKILSFQKKV